MSFENKSSISTLKIYFQLNETKPKIKVKNIKSKRHIKTKTKNSKNEEEEEEEEAEDIDTNTNTNEEEEEEKKEEEENDNNNNNNNNNDKIIKIDTSSTLKDVKKKIREIMKNMKHEIKFYYDKKELPEDALLSSIHQPTKQNIINVVFCKKKVTFVSISDTNEKHEVDVYLDEKINDYKKELRNEKVSNIGRIYILRKDESEIENETFFEYGTENTFSYDIEEDDYFSGFNEEWKQFNNQFFLETTIKELRNKIEERLGKENVRLMTNNKCLLNDLHLYEIHERIDIEINDKKVDEFLIKTEKCQYFHEVFPKLERKLRFTFDSTISDLRAVLEDLLRKEAFTIICNGRIIKDEEQRIFTVDNEIFIKNEIIEDLSLIKPVLFEMIQNKRMIVDVYLNSTVSQMVNHFVQEKKFEVEPKKRSVKVVYNGRIAGRSEKISDVLKYKEDGENENESESVNQTPVYIYYQPKNIKEE